MLLNSSGTPEQALMIGEVNNNTTKQMPKKLPWASTGIKNNNKLAELILQNPF